MHEPYQALGPIHKSILAVPVLGDYLWIDYLYIILSSVFVLINNVLFFSKDFNSNFYTSFIFVLIERLRRNGYNFPK